MPSLDLEQLIVEETAEDILETGLTIAENIGLPTSTWQEGDPTRAGLELTAEQLASKEGNRAGYARSGFLDYARGVWLEWLADQQFDVQVPQATFAETDVVLTNSGAQLYEIEEVGDLVVKNTTSGKTYTNTTIGVLSPGGTLTVTVRADEAGTESNAAATEIDDLVTGWSDVAVSNASAAIARDAQDEETTRAQCRRKLSSLTPNGAPGAYEYAALNQEWTGVTSITRAREYGDSATGTVNVYLAGPSGAVSSPDVAAAEDAILTYVTPLCITPVVASASAVTVAVTYALWIYTTVNLTEAEIEEAAEAALEAVFADVPIGGDIIPPATSGYLYKSRIEAALLAAFLGEAFRVTVSLPAGDTALTNSQVAALGAVTATINLVTP